MSDTKKMQAHATAMAKQIAKELMAEQAKLFQDEMKKIQDEMSKMKEKLSKKVEVAISGKNEATKDNASDVGAGEHAHGKEMYSNMGFDYGQLIKGPPYILLPPTSASHLTLMEQDTLIGLTR